MVSSHDPHAAKEIQNENQTADLANTTSSAQNHILFEIIQQLQRIAALCNLF